MSASCEFEYVPIIRNGMQVGERLKRVKRSQIYNDAMTLLMYVAARPDDYQTYARLSDATGIPQTTLKRLVKWHIENGKESCVLHYVAFKVGMIIHYEGRPGKIIFVRYATQREQILLSDARSPIYYDR
jgi:hypothetical protein